MSKRSVRIVALVCSLVLLFSMTACGSKNGTSQVQGSSSPSASGSASASPSNVSAGSKELSVYTAYPEEHVQKLFAKFEKDTGIKVKFVRLSAGEIYARVQAEANNPQASLWFGTSSETMIVAGKGGYLEGYESPMVKDVPEQFRDPNKLWTPHSAQTISFLTNQKWLDKNKVQAPTSWKQLLDPVYKDNIAIAHPATSGMSYTWLAYMVTLMGEDEAFNYIKELDKNIFQYAKSSNSPPRMVGMEECALTIAYNNQGMTNIDAGYPIAISYPEEGTSYEISAMALIKNGPADEAENARKFIDWSLSVEAQEEYASYSYMTPMNSNAKIPEGMKTLKDLKTIPIDTAWSSDNRERLLKRFETEIHSKEQVK